MLFLSLKRKNMRNSIRWYVRLMSNVYNLKGKSTRRRLSRAILKIESNFKLNWIKFIFNWRIARIMFFFYNKSFYFGKETLWCCSSSCFRDLKQKICFYKNLLNLVSMHRDVSADFSWNLSISHHLWSITINISILYLGHYAIHLVLLLCF